MSSLLYEVDHVRSSVGSWQSTWFALIVMSITRALFTLREETEFINHNRLRRLLYRVLHLLTI